MSPLRSLVATECRCGSGFERAARVSADRRRCARALRSDRAQRTDRRCDVGAGDARVEPDDRRHLQRMAHADLVVGRIVRRRHLHRAGAELGIDRLVGDDRNRTVEERRQPDAAADERRVTFVVRMHGDRDVGEHRLRARRRDRRCRDRDRPCRTGSGCATACRRVRRARARRRRRSSCAVGSQLIRRVPR